MTKPNMDAIRLDYRAFCYKYYRWRIIIPFIITGILSVLFLIFVRLPVLPSLMIILFAFNFPSAYFLHIKVISLERMCRESSKIYATADPAEI